MAKRTNIKTIRLVALILMLFPLLALIGVILYLVDTAQGKVTKVELIFLILTIPFGFLAGIFLWLNAFGVIQL